MDLPVDPARYAAFLAVMAVMAVTLGPANLFACATLTLDVLAMSAYGLGGAAVAARMTEPRFRRIFSVCVGVLLLSAALLMATKA